MNVFRQLSKANKVQSPILTLPFRIGAQALDNTPETNPASLLFYYLFDDWHTTYSLVARREHRYGEQLEELVRTPRSTTPNPLTPLAKASRSV